MQFPQVIERVSDLTLPHIRAILQKSATFKKHLLNPFSLSPDHQLSATLLGNARPGFTCLFFEDSTRTKTSFIKAGLNLGLHYIPFEVTTSSLNKGETLEETLLTLKQVGVEMAIFRTKEENILTPFKAHPPLGLINGGDGKNHHPSQALLDVFTMICDGHIIRGLKLAIVGDCEHSRVCYSLVELLSMLGAEIFLVAPKEMNLNRYQSFNIRHLTHIQQALEQVDVLYMLRIQKERHDQSKISMFENYREAFGITFDRLQSLNRKISVYHAGPANIGMEIDQQTIKSPFYRGALQVQNGVFIRMAMMELMIESAIKTFSKLSHQWDINDDKRINEGLLSL
jgi:aspartate carbamoyltransferase catalytic subunit